MVNSMQALEQILDQLDNSREKILVVLETLPDEALLTSGVINTWSIADLLVMLTAWESELVTAMMRLEQGRKPDKLLSAMSRRQAYNTALATSANPRNLDTVFDDWQQVRMQLEGWLENFSERDLTSRKRYKMVSRQSTQTNYC